MTEICAQCGSSIPGISVQGLCPRCLISTALNLHVLPEPSETAPPPAEDSKAGSRFGDYELLGEIARGGMGIVFRARQISLKRLVAVKALLFGEFASDEFVARFRGEAEAAARLQHPNIVSIYEFWQHAGQHFFSMELIEGKTLSELVADRPLAPKRAARYIELVARAVEYAHSRGVLHRDLKPSNILIDPADQPRILDFGLARRIDRGAAHKTHGRIVGSPEYMAPEQVGKGSGELGPWTDIYSLGALLYHLITGRPPVAGDTIEEILSQTVAAAPAAPRSLNKAIPRDLETICLKCLAKDPDQRYISAKHLADDLARFLEDRPILARPAGVAEKTIRWCRRNPAPTMLLVFLFCGALVATWAALHLRRLNQDVRIHSYVSDMNVAFRHFEEGSAGQAYELLKRHIPKPGETDLRGFEWRHLWWLCRGNYRDWLPTHPHVVGAIQFSADESQILTYTWNETVRAWDARSRRMTQTLTGITGLGGFSQHGHWLLSSTNGSVQAIDAKSGSIIKTIPDAGELVAFARQAGTIVTITPDRRLKVSDLETGRELLTVENVRQKKFEFSGNPTVVIAPDGSTLALVVPGENPLVPSTSVRLWEIASGRELAPLRENRELRSAAFSPNAKLLATGDGEGAVRVWDLATKKSESWSAHSSPTLALAWSPDGTTLATGASDQRSIRLWDPLTGIEKPGDFRGQLGDVWSLAFSPSGTRLASGTRDGLVRIWTLADVQYTNQIERLHADQYANIAFSPDGQRFAGGCRGNKVKVWDISNLKVVATIDRASYVVAFSTDGKRLLVSDHEGAAFWCHLSTQTAERVPDYNGELKEVVSVDLSRDRKLAALGLASGKIRLLDLDTGEMVRDPFSGHVGPVRSVAFSPAGDKLASGGSDKNVFMWDVKSGSALGMCPEHKGGVFGVTISPDGKTLASGCGAETIKLWNVDEVGDGSWASASYHKSVIRSLSFSPDNRTLASGSEDKTVKFWNFVAFSKTTSRREVGSITFDDALRSVLFAPDGNTLAAVTDRGAVRLFRAATLAQADQELREMR